MTTTLAFLDFARLSGLDVSTVTEAVRRESVDMVVASDAVADLFPGALALPSLRSADEFAAEWLDGWFRSTSHLSAAATLANFSGVPIWDAAWLSLAFDLYRPVGAVWRALQLLSKHPPTRLLVITGGDGLSWQARALRDVAQHAGIPQSVTTVPGLEGVERSVADRWRALKRRARDWTERNLMPQWLALAPKPGIPPKRRARIVFADFFSHNVPALMPVHRALERAGEAELLWLGMHPDVSRQVRGTGAAGLDMLRLSAGPQWKRVRRREHEMDHAFSRLVSADDFRKTFQIDGVPVASLLLESFRHVLWHTNRWGSRWAAWTEYALRQCDADVVVTSNDTSQVGQTLAFACRRLEVPCVYVQHGIVPFDPYAIAGRADVLLIWGEISRQAFNRLGNRSEQLRLTGAAQYDRFFSGGDVAPLPSSFRAKPAAPLVVFTSQPPARGVPESVYRRTVRAVLQTVKTVSDVEIVIKLHPIEAPDVINELVKEAGIAARVVKECDTRSLLKAADVVITQYSTTGLEALLLGKPLVTINLSGEPDRAPYALAGAAVGVYSPGELADAVRRCLDHAETRGRLAEQREIFLREMFASRDGSASGRCAQEILAVAAGRRVAARPSLPVEVG